MGGIGLTYNQILDKALAMPGVQEEMQHKNLVLKRNGRFMMRPMIPGEWRLEGQEPKRGDGGIFVIRVTWEQYDALMEKHPNIFFTKAHFVNYPSIMFDSADLSSELADQVLAMAWEASQAKTSKRMS